MNAVKVGSVDVDRQAVDLFFDGAKVFYADVLNERINAPSMDRLKEKVRERMRVGDLKLAIPATIVEVDPDAGASGVKFRDVRLIGTHGGSGKVLYREGNRTDTISGYRDEILSAHLSPAARAKAKALRQTLHDAEAAWTRWEEQVKLANNGKELVEQEKAKRIAAKQRNGGA